MWPDRIFIYRDGASDGQFAAIKEFEVEQIKAAFKAVDPNYK